MENTITIELEGAHGTTCSRARKIIKQGFHPSGMCFWGHGVYFFHREKDGKEDAKKWYQQSSAHNSYKIDKDKRCAILYAKISTSENNFLDVTKEEFISSLEELNAFLKGRSLDDDQKNRIRDSWLLDFEEMQGTPIKVLNTTIPLPRKIYKPKKQAECILVRDTNCIKRPFDLEVLQ